jgi:protein TonB
MLAEFDPRPLSFISRGTLLSVVAHAAVFLVIAVWTDRAPQIAHFKLPGTVRGISLLTYYSPGSHQRSRMASAVRTNLTKNSRVPSRKVVRPAPIPAEPLTADSGPGTAAESGIGEGDVNIALPHHFPSPQPDLSPLPHGASGDVILDAVIDEHGKISSLTLLKGLAPSIDEAVIATVKEWSFTPATKDGMPVVSEQEFHFHYERG